MEEGWEFVVGSMVRTIKEHGAAAPIKNQLGLRKELPRACESREVVRPADCDLTGQLSHGRLIEHALDTRVLHWLRFQDLDLRAHAKKHGAGFVAKEVELSYLRPIRPMEEVLTRTRLLAVEEQELLNETLVLDAKGRLLKALLLVRYHYIDLKTGVQKPYPEELAAQLRSLQLRPGVLPARGLSQRLEAVTKELSAR
jgi:acyl-CoA thioesterase FadM